MSGMEFSILIDMVLIMAGCLVGVAVLAILVFAGLLVTGKGFGRSLNGGWWLGVFPLIIPVTMISCGGGFAIPFFEVVMNGVQTTGRVVDYAESSGDGSTTYSSIVEFETETGETIRFDDAAVTSNPPRHAIGQELPVRYLRDTPEQAIVDGDLTMWGVLAVLILVTVVATPIMAVIGWNAFRKNAPIVGHSSTEVDI